MSATFKAYTASAKGQKLTPFEFNPGSPFGCPATTTKMLVFCARHGIAPAIEKFPGPQINEALEHLRAGKARYRIVLENGIE